MLSPLQLHKSQHCNCSFGQNGWSDDPTLWIPKFRWSDDQMIVGWCLLRPAFSRIQSCLTHAVTEELVTSVKTKIARQLVGLSVGPPSRLLHCWRTHDKVATKDWIGAIEKLQLRSLRCCRIWNSSNNIKPLVVGHLVKLESNNACEANQRLHKFDTIITTYYYKMVMNPQDPWTITGRSPCSLVKNFNMRSKFCLENRHSQSLHWVCFTAKQ